MLVMKPDEVADMLGCAVTTVEEQAATGELPGLKFGRGWVFPVDALAQRLNEKALQVRPRQAPSPKAVVVPVVPRASRVGRRSGPLPVLPTLPGMGVGK